ncbi:hypothetical protein FACS1894171_0050 [Clostridia bacterium]|nr:hypothetical protein FACS1894171_0050 [Clostridia bacterium]
MEPLVGPARVFFYPHGAYIKNGKENLDKLGCLTGVGAVTLNPVDCGPVL